MGKCGLGSVGGEVVPLTKFGLLGLLLLTFGIGSPAWASDGPLRLRNTAPVAQLYGLPRALGVVNEEAGVELSFNVEHSSNFTSDRIDRGFAFFDGETTVLSYGVTKSFDRWEVGGELPYVLHTSGGLDNWIDEFHDLFGLEDGGRTLARRNQLDYLVRYDGVDYAGFKSNRRRMGDIRTWVGYSIFADAGRALTVRGTLKLPTGKVKSLSGSEGTDVAVSLEYADSHLLSSLGIDISAMLAVTRLGEGELVKSRQNSSAFSGHLGLIYQYSSRLDLIAQIDAHSELLDAGVRQIGGAAVQGVLGGRYAVTPKFWVDFGLVEDLRSQSSPDVIFQLMLGAKL